MGSIIAVEETCYNMARDILAQFVSVSTADVFALLPMYIGKRSVDTGRSKLVRPSLRREGKKTCFWKRRHGTGCCCILWNLLGNIETSEKFLLVKRHDPTNPLNRFLFFFLWESKFCRICCRKLWQIWKNCGVWKIKRWKKSAKVHEKLMVLEKILDGFFPVPRMIIPLGFGLLRLQFSSCILSWFVTVSIDARSWAFATLL